MNKIKLFLSALVLCLFSVPAFAQSTASPVISGYLTTTGCPSGSSVCFKTANSYSHISTATNTQVFTGAGEIYTLSVNDKGAGAGTATLYNNTSCTGSIFAVVDLNNNDPVTVTYNAKLSTGLCVTTSEASDITITYRTN